MVDAPGRRSVLQHALSAAAVSMAADGNGEVRAAAAEVRPGVSIAYVDDYFGPPWSVPQPVVLLHGNGESGLAWQQWVGPLGAEYRVIRPDMPGFGRSPAADGYTYSPHELAADYAALLTRLRIDRCHLVGAKYGGTVALQLAADYPARVMTLAVFGTPVRGANTGGQADLTTFPALIAKIGVRAWSEQSQPARLGRDASAAQLQWWSDVLMGGADPHALIAATTAVAQANVEADLGRITAPTLVVTTADSPLQPVSSARDYQEKIGNSRLLVMPGDSYHVAAVHPRECAQAALDFIRAAGAGR